MSAPRFLAIPTLGWNQIRVLLSLDASKLTSLQGILTSEDMLADSDTIELRLTDTLGISRAEALAVLSACANLREQREYLGLSDEELLADLAVSADEVDSLTLEAKEALLRLLRRLPEEVERTKQRNKSTRLGKALIPWLTDATTICDVRPVFDTDRDEVQSFLLSVLVGVSTHSPADHEAKTLVFQTDREGLGRLRKAIELAEKKLRVLEGTLSGQFTVE